MKPRSTQPAWIADRSGVAAIEAALGISLVLIPLCLGIICLGLMLGASDRLDRALQAAMLYAWANPGTPSAWGSPGSTNLAGARSAALAAYGADSSGATITASVAFYCVADGYTQILPAVADTASCQAGQVMGTWLTISASTSVTPPGLPNAVAIPLSVNGSVRVQ